MPLAQTADRLRAAATAFLDRRRDRALILALVVVGLVLAAPGMLIDAQPHSDGLFYEAQVAQLSGDSRATALHDVFTGPRAHAVARIEDGASGLVRVLDPDWVAYSAQFYQRRWLVPALALGVESIAGVDAARALQIVSMLGYALTGAAVFGLLRRRYPASTSTLIAATALLCPFLYRWSFGQYVDSWGVLLETAGLTALVLVVDRGYRWLPAWVAAMAALSITRDATAVLGAAALGLLLARWHRRPERPLLLLTVVLGALVSTPALLLGGTPIRQTLAYEYNSSQVPPHDDWAFVLRGYPGQLWSTIRSNATYPATFGVVPASVLYATLAVAAVGLVVVVLNRPGDDALLVLARGALVGCVVLLLITNFPQGYRLELVLLPVTAIGLAHVTNELVRAAAELSAARSVQAGNCNLGQR